ncbi:hypothetical protein F11_03270 [Rhodospirillum rubrum F11]|nr:hypothetical protein F11_03270 [Rhodospirillum rubrum F11]
MRLGGSAIERNILSSIHSASQKTGVSFAFMLAKARRESNFQADASNASSSAQGLYQFTHQTWLEQVKLHGADYGLGDLAAHIIRTPSGRYDVDSPEVRKQILALRHDPDTSAAMAAEYASDNRRLLAGALGRPVTDTDLYLSHFFGPGGAIEFLRAMDSQPNATGAEVLPKAARTNPDTFYAADGRARPLTEIYAIVGHGIDSSMRRFAGAATAAAMSGKVPLAPEAKPEGFQVATLAEDMAGETATASAVLGAPLPLETKPASPAAEDIGRTRQIAEATPPRPMVFKPLAEDMSRQPVAPTPPTPPAEILVAEATVPSPAPPAAPPAAPVGSAYRVSAAARSAALARAQAAQSDRTVAGARSDQVTPAAERLVASTTVERLVASTTVDRSVAASRGTPAPGTTLMASAFPSEEDRALATRVLVATERAGLRREMATADMAHSAARVFAALAAADLPPGSATPISDSLGEDALAHQAAPSGSLPHPDMLADLMLADAADKPDDAPLVTAEATTQARETLPDESLPGIDATKPLPAVPPLGTTTYSVLAVVESFDPTRHLTEISGQMPGLTTAPHVIPVRTTPAPEATGRATTAALAPPPAAPGQTTLAASEGPILRWLRTMTG